MFESVPLLKIDVNKPLNLKHSKSRYNEVKGQGAADQRFMFDVKIDDLDKMKEGYCPPNTVKNNAWALKTFEEWQVARNNKFPVESSPMWLAL